MTCLVELVEQDVLLLVLHHPLASDSPDNHEIPVCFTFNSATDLLYDSDHVRLGRVYSHVSTCLNPVFLEAIAQFVVQVCCCGHVTEKLDKLARLGPLDDLIELGQGEHDCDDLVWLESHLLQLLFDGQR